MGKKHCILKKPSIFANIRNKMAKGSLNVPAMLVCVSLCAFTAAAGSAPTFSVGSYGARADGQTDDSNVCIFPSLYYFFFLKN